MRLWSFTGALAAVVLVALPAPAQADAAAAGCGYSLVSSSVGSIGVDTDATALHVFDAPHGSVNKTYMLVGTAAGDGVALHVWNATQTPPTWSTAIQTIGFVSAAGGFTSWVEPSGALSISIAAMTSSFSSSYVLRWDATNGQLLGTETGDANSVSNPAGTSSGTISWVDADQERWVVYLYHGESENFQYDSSVYQWTGGSGAPSFNLGPVYGGSSTNAPVGIPLQLGEDAATWEEEGVRYLALASGSQYSSNSFVYRWSGTGGLREAEGVPDADNTVANITTYRARAMETWVASDGHRYLGVANSGVGNTTFVYRWSGPGGLLEAGAPTAENTVAMLATGGAYDITALADPESGKEYLMVVDKVGGSTVVYDWDAVLSAGSGDGAVAASFPHSDDVEVATAALLPSSAGEGAPRGLHLMVATSSTGVTTYAVEVQQPSDECVAAGGGTDVVVSDVNEGSTGKQKTAKTVFVVRAGATFITEAGSVVDIGA